MRTTVSPLAPPPVIGIARRGIDTQTFQAAFEAPANVYWGAVSRGELTGPNALDVWSDVVARFTVTRTTGP